MQDASRFNVPPRVEVKWRIHRSTGELFVRCPGCNKEQGLRNHTINELTGEVSPSFWCAFAKMNAGCDVHTWVHLRQWWERSCSDIDV